MSLLPLTLACWHYDRVAPLATGRVRVEGVDLRLIQIPIEELFFRTFHHHEFDVSEMSLSSYMMARAKGPWEYEAIPVFLSRMFRHSAIFIRRDSGIERPEDLKGRRIGVPEYAQTAAMTARGILEDDYGVKPQDVTWFTGGLEQPGRQEKFALKLPSAVQVCHAGTESLSQMLVDGTIDALISARNPSCFVPNGSVIRLFRHHRQTESEFYRRTGVFPIMHTVGIRSVLVRQHPWLPASLAKAFQAAKDIVLAEIDGTGGACMASLPWMADHVAEARALMGEDYWPYGVSANRQALKAAARWSYAQGLTDRLLEPRELFCASAIDQPRV